MPAGARAAASAIRALSWRGKRNSGASVFASASTDKEVASDPVISPAIIQPANRQNNPDQTLVAKLRLSGDLHLAPQGLFARGEFRLGFSKTA